jgi:hypothetical protein
VTYEETPKSKRAVLSLSRAVSDGIESTGAKPRILSSLPSTSLIERSIRYFRNHTILNHHYYVADENILQLDVDTDAVLARYTSGREKPYLLVVEYPTKQRAENARKSFVNAYMPDAPEKDTLQTENDKWTAVGLHERVLSIVFDAPSRNSARALLEGVHTQPEGKP